MTGRTSASGVTDRGGGAKSGNEGLLATVTFDAAHQDGYAASCPGPKFIQEGGAIAQRCICCG
jgi:hypothetical protein